MAHRRNGPVVPRRYTVRGIAKSSEGMPVPLSFEINGELSILAGVESTNHVADCLAAICVMVDADSKKVTQLTVDRGVEGHTSDPTQVYHLQCFRGYANS